MNSELLHQLWVFLPKGYLFTTLIETPVLLIGLSPRHSWRRRVLAGIWLNACSYPVVAIAMPLCFGLEPPTYLAVAEVFAPVCECTLFALAFHDAQTPRADCIRDLVTIVIANLASFLLGLWAAHNNWLVV